MAAHEHPTNRHATSTPLDPLIVTGAADDAFRRIVHEIAGLVDGSLRYIKLAQRDLNAAAPAPPGLDHVEAAAHALDRLADIVNQTSRSLAELSRVNVARPLPSDQSLGEVLDHALNVLAPAAEDAGVSLNAQISDDARNAPPLPLYPVVANALRNAIEVAARGDRVTLRAHLEHDDTTPFLVVQVADNGPGLARDPELLFDAAISSKPGHPGLGLPIARDIVAQLGGETSIQNNEDSPGATFIARIPLSESNE